ncbi:MAG: hypothetical protein IBJ10_06760 [Phycisphaerales bacterium]|nr:hypothetical protein [Phycisphaerales bacterium]
MTGADAQGGFGPFASSIRGELVAVQEASIHGDLYYDLTARTDAANNRGVKVRAPSHACRQAPRVGQRVRIELLMGQVTSVVVESEGA